MSLKKMIAVTLNESPFRESYYTIKYRELKEIYPQEWGLDVALQTWKAKATSAALDGYAEVVPFMEAMSPLVIQTYEDREIGSETPGRFMWLADRLYSLLCTKYAGAISKYPVFDLADRTEETTGSGSATNDSTTTNNNSGTVQQYPDYVDPEKLATDFTTAGSKSDSAMHTAGTSGDTYSETKKSTDVNRTQLWQSLIKNRVSLTEAYIQEFDKLFLRIIGDDLII